MLTENLTIYTETRLCMRSLRESNHKNRFFSKFFILSSFAMWIFSFFLKGKSTWNTSSYLDVC